MLKKIKRKFLIITFTSIFLVVSFIVGYINLYNYTSNLDKHEKVITHILSNNDNTPQIEQSINRYIVIIDIIDDTYFIRRGSLEESIDIVILVDNILIMNTEYGYYSDFVFGIKELENNKVLVLSNILRDKELTSTYLYNSLIISSIGILVVYFIIYLSSSYILKPFIKNEENQKEFITNASHELKTPLTIIKANLDVLKIDNLDNEWTQSIENQVDRLELLTNNLVELSKIDELEKNIVLTEFSLSDAILEVSSNYNIVFTDKGIDLNIDVKDNISFDGNEKQIRDIVKLIIDNMIKYSTTTASIVLNEKELIFSNSTELNDGNYDDIFNRFVRVDSSRNQSISGYGIGLSIVKKIIEIHNKTITATVVNNQFIIKIKL